MILVCHQLQVIKYSKSPELIEGYISSNYDINNIIVLKSCDVLSLAIIYCQMINCIEYLPFRLFKKPININKTKYQFIKYGQYHQFWNIHKKCNIMKIGDDAELLRNLFEQMFEYNPYQRITISQILSHKLVVSNENNPLFHMNDSKLEAFVRERYHQTKNIDNDDIKHTIAPSTYYDSKLGGVTSSVNNDETSGFNMHSYLNRDSSGHQINENESKVYLDEMKIVYSFKPCVVFIGIEKYGSKNLKDKKSVIYDYANVKQMLNHVKHFDIIYHNKKHEIVHLQENNNCNQSSVNLFNEKEFALSWTINDLDKFVCDVFNIFENGNYNYDCLLFFLSCHFKKLCDKSGKHILYDSNGHEYHDAHDDDKSEMDEKKNRF